MKRLFIVFLMASVLVVGLVNLVGIYGFFQKLFRFNQHTYSYKILSVTHNGAPLWSKTRFEFATGKIRDPVIGPITRLHKGDKMVELHSSGGCFKVLMPIKNFREFLANKKVVGWINGKYVREEGFVYKKVYSEKVDRRKFLILKDPRIGFIPGFIKISGKPYPVGTGFPFIGYLTNEQGDP